MRDRNGTIEPPVEMLPHPLVVVMTVTTHDTSAEIVERYTRLEASGYRFVARHHIPNGNSVGIYVYRRKGWLRRFLDHLF